MNILLVSAHPDDMEIGMGGTAAKLAAQGNSLISVVFTDGRRSANPFAFSADVLAQTRQQEAKNAATILSIQDLHFCNLPDLKSEQNFESAVRQLSEIIKQLNPQEIYTLHPELDRHSSHQMCGKAVLQAVKNLERHDIVLWAYEVWGLFDHWDRFEDITATVGKKLQAIGEHRSQVATVPYGEGVIGLNRWRAVFADPQQACAPAAFAEVFLRLTPQES